MRKMVIMLTIGLLPACTAWAGWVPQASGVGSTLRGVSFADSLHGVAGGDQFMPGDTVLWTDNGGTTWRVTRTGIPASYRAFDLVTPQIGYAATDQGPFKTTNGGQSWVQQWVFGGLYGISFCDLQRGLVVGLGGNVLRTTNGGSTWVQETTNVKRDLFDVCMVDSLHAWACGYDGGGDSFAIVVTRDGGQTWAKQKTPPFQTPVPTVAVFFLDTLAGWAVGESYSLIYTTDGGLNWTAGTTGSNFMDIVFVDGQYGWMVGCRRSTAAIGVSTDGGRNWTPQTPGVTNTLYSVSFIGRRQGWAVGDNGTILHTSDGGAGVEEERPGDKGTRRQREGLKVSPNPFASFTKVSEHEGERFEAYDITGKRVGTYWWNRIGNDLSPGVYFLKQEGKEERPQRVVKVK